MKKKFGQIIREKRIEKKISQEELSHLANVTKNLIGMAERGETNLTILSMEKIADGLQADLKISLDKK